jgi:hypothetical protein
MAKIVSKLAQGTRKSSLAMVSNSAVRLVEIVLFVFIYTKGQFEPAGLGKLIEEQFSTGTSILYDISAIRGF